MTDSTACGSGSTRLVIIRGNSGSGKSSVAAGLRAARPQESLAVIGQDLVRRTILGAGDGAGTLAVGLIDLTARYALGHGLDVVIEGIMNAARYGDMLARLRRDHAGETRAYLYDLAFEETLRRHAAKAVSGYGEAEMREWWHGFQPVEGLDEAVVGESASLDDTVARILADCWGAEPPAVPVVPHFPYLGDA